MKKPKTSKRGSKEWKTKIMLTRSKLGKQTAIRKARTLSLLSQKDLAKKLDISAATLTGIETGARPVKQERAASISKLLKLNSAQAFKKSSRLKNKYIAR